MKAVASAVVNAVVAATTAAVIVSRARTPQPDAVAVTLMGERSVLPMNDLLAAHGCSRNPTQPSTGLCHACKTGQARKWRTLTATAVRRTAWQLRPAVRHASPANAAAVTAYGRDRRERNEV